VIFLLRAAGGDANLPASPELRIVVVQADAPEDHVLHHHRRPGAVSARRSRWYMLAKRIEEGRFVVTLQMVQGERAEGHVELRSVPVWSCTSSCTVSVPAKLIATGRHCGCGWSESGERDGIVLSGAERRVGVHGHRFGPVEHGRGPLQA
jgi:hypothetical protein